MSCTWACSSASLTLEVIPGLPRLPHAFTCKIRPETLHISSPTQCELGFLYSEDEGKLLSARPRAPFFRSNVGLWVECTAWKMEAGTCLEQSVWVPKATFQVRGRHTTKSSDGSSAQPPFAPRPTRATESGDRAPVHPFSSVFRRVPGSIIR